MADSQSDREPVCIGDITPILNVRSLDASLRYYIDVLGFVVDWNWESEFASVSRDGKCIMLCQNGQGHAGTWLWVGTNDADALCAEYRSKGATIRLEPTTFPWAREMRVEDPDGHVLRFGSDPEHHE